MKGAQCFVTDQHSDLQEGSFARLGMTRHFSSPAVDGVDGELVVCTEVRHGEVAEVMALNPLGPLT